MDRLKKGIIGLCFIVLFLPLLQQMLHFINVEKLQENRNMRRMPTGIVFIQLYLKGTDYSRAFEQYYNDNFGFRDFLIRVKNQLDYSVWGLKEGYSDELLIGKEGYLYYRGELEVEQAISDRMSDAQIEKAVGHFKKLQSSLRQKGTQLVVLPIEIKNQIYPEYLPSNSIVRKNPNSYERLMTRLRQVPELVVVEATPILLESKKIQPVYYKTDSHWNDFGAYSVGKALVSQLQKLARQKESDNYQITFKQQEFSGGQNNNLAIFFPPTENAWVVDKILMQDSAILNDDKRFNGHWKANRPDDADKIPLTVMVGNSFTGTFTGIGFFNNFSEAYWLHSDKKSKVLEYLPSGTKFVVYQFLDADIAFRVAGDQFWP